MGKKKRIPKHFIVTPEIALWRNTLKVGDKVKLDGIIDKREPVGIISEVLGIERKTGPHFAYIVEYNNWMDHPRTLHTAGGQSLWPLNTTEDKE